MATAAVVEVRRSMLLADVDDTLRKLLETGLAEVDLDEVRVTFDAPDRDWSAALTVPTINLFLHDLREAKDHRPTDWRPSVVDGRVVEQAPPLMLDGTYAITAWARAVEDEHRLLSQAIAILQEHPELPHSALTGDLADPARQPFPITMKLGRPRAEARADFWNAIGGKYKTAIDLVVTVASLPGRRLVRGPRAATRSVRIGIIDVPRSSETWHDVGGVVTDDADAPLADVWIVAPQSGAFCLTEKDGRYVLPQLREGDHVVLARRPDGVTSEHTISAPGRADLVLPAKKRRR